MGRVTGEAGGISERKDSLPRLEMIRREGSLILLERQGDAVPYEREMFLTCRINGLLPARSAAIGGVTCLIYRTEGWFALTDSRCPRAIDDALITDVANRLKALRQTLRSYLLISGHLLLDPAYVYVNRDGGIAFIYCPGGGKDSQADDTAEEAEQAFLFNLRSLSSKSSGMEGRRTGTAPSQWGDYLEAAEGEDLRSEDEDRLAAGPGRKKRLDFYTITVTLFLIGVMLAVFVILKSGVLDQLLQYIPVIGGG